MRPATAGPRRQRLAINTLKDLQPVSSEAIDQFLAQHEIPVVEGDRATFLFRGEADAVSLSHWIVGLPSQIPLRRLHGTDLWYVVIDLPASSRVEYKLEVRRGGSTELLDDPLNPKLSYNPMGQNSVVFASGYEAPDWTFEDPDARPGSLTHLTLPSRALKRDASVAVYLPARFRRSGRYPLLVVHDGSDFLQYAAAKTVLDNLIHRLDVGEVVVAFTDPGDRLTEYADHPPHARWLTKELVPHLEAEFPLLARPSGRCLMGSSFGAVASLSTANRHPGFYGSLLLESGSFVFTDIGNDHGGGAVFDPVVKFVNAFRGRPRRVVDRAFVTCGVYEPLIVRNRSLVPVLRETGMDVRYIEARDGHNWVNWRDRLRDGLSWIFPGPHKLYYE